MPSSFSSHRSALLLTTIISLAGSFAQARSGDGHKSRTSKKIEATAQLINTKLAETGVLVDHATELSIRQGLTQLADSSIGAGLLQYAALGATPPTSKKYGCFRMKIGGGMILVGVLDGIVCTNFSEVYFLTPYFLGQGGGGIVAAGIFYLETDRSNIRGKSMCTAFGLAFWGGLSSLSCTLGGVSSDSPDFYLIGPEIGFELAVYEMVYRVW